MAVNVTGSPPRAAEPAHLHVHSSSLPAWARLSDSDPAVDLIRAIKEELNKFDHPSGVHLA